MATATSTPPVVLIAAVREQSLASVLEGSWCAVVQVRTGTLAVAWARDLRPDTIILEAGLPDMSAVDACRMLHGDLRIGHNVPILILSPDKPTPEQRVAALRAGAWDFLLQPGDPEELSLKLQAYVQAKRNIDVALADGQVDPTIGLHSRPVLARRARELGALLARTHGAFSCVVFELEPDAADPQAGSLVARAARVSDVVGALGPSEFAVLAPATDSPGALKLAQRVADSLRDVIGERPPGAPPSLRAGYDAVANFKYSPIDPVELLTRAAAAVRTGKPEPDHPWVRRFDTSRTSGPDWGAAPRNTPPGVVADLRRTSS
ncbi:MAG TPA: response regulator [Gemmatimonadales bacterium]